MDEMFIQGGFKRLVNGEARKTAIKGQKERDNILCASAGIIGHELEPGLFYFPESIAQVAHLERILVTAFIVPAQREA